ncbi:MAG: putative 2OG-Fe(II) oxygenase [Steroidobacteraceae bacterium]
MISLTRSQLVAIAGLLQQRRLGEAEAACRTLLGVAPQDAAAIHMLGLIREQAGDPVLGERLLRQSLALEPQNPHFLGNLAQLLRRCARHQEAAELLERVLERLPGERPVRRSLILTLNELGQYAAAEAQCRTLIRQASGDAEAWTLLAFVLGNQNRLAEAESAYRRALSIDDRQALAHHNLGSLLSRQERAEEALQALDRASALGANGFELLVNRGRTLSLLYRHDEAERAFEQAITLKPFDIDAQTNLARLRFMRGDEQFARDFAAAAVAHPGNPGLQTALAAVFNGAGRIDLAEQHLRRVLAGAGARADLRASLAHVLHQRGQLEDAHREASAAVSANPDDAVMVETLVLILLSLGRADEVLFLVGPQRSRAPLAQNWIAYEATAARLLGRDQYRELYDYGRFVRIYELEPPPGWGSVAELNAALLEVLAARHRFSSHPLDQSLRNGSQTARSLTAESEPAIQAVLKAFAEPLADYQRQLGNAPTHPLSMRNVAAASIVGAWSVQLHREGFHVNHLHPQGWISSAYYVDVPDEVEDANEKAGWLKFGETRYPVPGASAERHVQPRAGRLVLFPSYMWHGTNPIHRGQPRMSIAFDAVPGDA